MKTEKIKITGMTCKSCEMLITDALEELDGVSSVSVSSQKGEATVTFDEKKVTLTAIKQAIRDEDFTV